MGDVLNPVEPLKSLGLEVRELRWPDAMEFLRRLGEHVSKLAGEGGKIELDQQNLVGLIAGSQELAEFLVLKSTGKDDAWLADRTPMEVLQVLDKAIPLNLSPELVAMGKRVAGHVQVGLGVNLPPATSGA